MRRPGTVVAAGVLLIVFGGLTALFAALLLLFTPLGSARGTWEPGTVIIGVVLLGFGVGEIVAGSKILALNPRGRVTGIVLASVGAAGFLAELVREIVTTHPERIVLDPETFAPRPAGNNVRLIVLWVIVIAAYGFIAVALARARRAFARAEP